MKRQKLLKVAGGALAAAMSLAMLAGCSGNTTSGSSSTGETGTAKPTLAVFDPTNNRKTPPAQPFSLLCRGRFLFFGVKKKRKRRHGEL